jgi:NADH-quinone oxidoreductase subunit B
VLQGIDRIIPVDIYIPGCPPRPEAVIDGLIKLQYRVQHERQPQVCANLHGSGRKIE